MTDILVVDDDPALGALLTLILRRHGYTVIHVSDGHCAQRAVQVHPVDVVLTDIVMPEVDGLELITWLRSTNAPPRIIAMSGNPRAAAGSYLEVASRCGADRVMEKPFTTAQLLEVLRDLMATEGFAPAREHADQGRRQ
jgi:CheY-like chemotaxis protein